MGLREEALIKTASINFSFGEVTNIINRITNPPHPTPDGKPLPFRIYTGDGIGKLKQVDSLTGNKQA